MTPRQCRQYTDHYDPIWNADFGQAMFEAFQAAGFTALDSEMSDFCHELWKQGFKVSPVAEPAADVAIYDETLPDELPLLDQPPGIYYTARTATGPQTRFHPDTDDFKTGTND